MKQSFRQIVSPIGLGKYYLRHILILREEVRQYLLHEIPRDRLEFLVDASAVLQALRFTTVPDEFSVASETFSVNDDIFVLAHGEMRDLSRLFLGIDAIDDERGRNISGR